MANTAKVIQEVAFYSQNAGTSGNAKKRAEVLLNPWSKQKNVPSVTVSEFIVVNKSFEKIYTILTEKGCGFLHFCLTLLL